ncbi:uncharacterized protein F5147DRAFT_689814 [Suillus discolor]|uniref:CDR ABC transporter domain-containing protein n=1 Tax=Suillus discolor TaxID=1912936 RepID=A0A9P7F9W3_9AGAM|nr:uncharacterized protein F5147DRAFT_689814 [Suillus discolor]KAG2110262.1 hypothetical protein F5147DRAFT_689814 [Suillus discolor]
MRQVHGYLHAIRGQLSHEPRSCRRLPVLSYTTTDQYMFSRLNIAYDNHWHNLGIVFGFVAFNIIAIFWFTISCPFALLVCLLLLGRS